MRFFTGGAQTVRGYAYQSLGPVDADGKVVGGRYLMIGSIQDLALIVFPDSIAGIQHMFWSALDAPAHVLERP